MSSGFDLVGAIGADGLRNQFVVVRVNNVDGEVLRRKLAQSGAKGAALAGAAVFVTDHVPKAALDVALPIAASQLKQYGIDATITAADAPPAKGRPTSEFFPGLAVGAGTVLGGWALWHFLRRLLGGVT